MTTPFARTRAVDEAGHVIVQLWNGRLRTTWLEALRVTAEALRRHYPDATNLHFTAQLVPSLWAKPTTPRYSGAR